ncbi:Phosphoribosyl 1,2-cyclic phosphodiesterase [compost metagenome]
MNRKVSKGVHDKTGQITDQDGRLDEQIANPIVKHINDETGDRLTFWGTGDAMGVPRVYCECGVCQDAREQGVNRRYRSSVLLESKEGSFLIDCGPDWRTAMERHRVRFAEQILVTHAHFDHIGGLPEWADSCRWLNRRGKLYAPQEVIDIIIRQYPWLPGQLDMHPIGQGLELAGWHIEGWKVFHGKNGYSYAYRLTKRGYVWAYCSDAIALPEEQKAPLHGLDLLILGTSFYEEKAEFSTRSVYDIKEALELLQEIQPKRSLFTHLSHDIDLRRDYGLPDNVGLAYTGKTVLLK